MTDEELDALLAGLSSPGPAPDFADRVMARVAVVRPALAPRWSFAVVAALVLVVLGAMAASIVWTSTHQAVLAGAGHWLTTEAASWALAGLRAVVGSFAGSPGAALVKQLAARPLQVAAFSALGSLLYAGGALALRHLMALPASRRLHASA